MADAPLPRFAATPEDIPSREVLLSMSGLAFMQAMLDGRIPQSPMARLLGFGVSRVEDGRVTFAGAAAFGHANPVGGVHGGWYGALLDSAMGCAVMTKVPQGRWYTTLEYRVSLVRALPIGTGVVCEAVVDHAGRTTAVARGEIRGAADGRLYATGSTTCIILD